MPTVIFGDVAYREAGRIALRRVDWRSPCLPKGGRCIERASSDQSRGDLCDPFDRLHNNAPRTLV